MKDTDEKCPNCGAVNPNHKRTADHTPKTIEELKQWYDARHLPPYETTRFFIGIDYKKPKAFGIYEDNGEFVVYKNKANGARAIRYRGTDEEYAVNELYLKLKSEIVNQKARNNSSSCGEASKSNQKETNKPVALIEKIKWFGIVVLLMMSTYTISVALGKLLLYAGIPAVAFFLIKKYVFNKNNDTHEKIVKWLTRAIIIYEVIAVIGVFSSAVKSLTPHYYHCDGNTYCYYNYDYYEYDDYTDDYIYINKDALPVQIINNGPDYEFDAEDVKWDSSYTFENSNYYNENLKSSSDDSWDDDSYYDWDSGDDWDSGSSDWNSDW